MLNISIDEYAEELRKSGLVVKQGAVLLPNHEKSIDVGDGSSIEPTYKLALCYKNEWSVEEIYKGLRSDPNPDEYNEAKILSFVHNLRTCENLQLSYVLTRDLGNSDAATSDFLGMKLHIYAKQGDYAIRISAGILKSWGKTLDEVKQLVQVSQNWQCVTIEEALRKSSEGHSLANLLAGSQFEMYVVTNENCIDGAAVLLDTLEMERLRAHFGDLTIIPSSKHEIIIVPMHYFDDFDMIREMIREVNDTVVDYDIVLSYDVFTFTERGLEIA